ncbi:unnamed protein product, partial [Polarella glacialis]
VICERGCARLSPVASKASSGAAELVPVFGVNKLPAFLGKARELGWHVAGTALPGEGDEESGVAFGTLEEFLPECSRLGGGVILVMGPEGPGLRSDLRQACSTLLRIDGGSAEDGLDSLNVSVAAGISLHALRAALGPPAPLGRDRAIEDETVVADAEQ